MTDSFYTPTILADKLISYISCQRNFNNVVDFCVGDGELLRSAEKRWPSIQCYGSDISKKAIKITKGLHPYWLLSKFDFLNFEQRSKSKLFKSKNYFDLILLNPPFSCWGGTLMHSNIDDVQFTTSTSMKFITEALKYLSPDGVLYAILPLSVAHSQKDKKVWKYLEEKYNLSILEETSIRYFKNCEPNIILVSLNDNKKSNHREFKNRSNFYLDGITILRGRVSIHKILKYPGEDYLVHTTNLKNNSIQELNTKVGHKFSLVTGPAILLPRVGKPDFSKVCIIKPGEAYCISDCLIALQCESMNVALTIFSFLANDWENVSTLYRGTGAHYITMEKIEQYLNLDTPVPKHDTIISIQ